MSETTPAPAAPQFADPATCEHPQWLPYHRRIFDNETMSARAYLFAWCPRCDEKRTGPEEVGM